MRTIFVGCSGSLRIAGFVGFRLVCFLEEWDNLAGLDFLGLGCFELVEVPDGQAAGEFRILYKSVVEPA